MINFIANWILFVGIFCEESVKNNRKVAANKEDILQTLENHVPDNY